MKRSIGKQQVSFLDHNSVSSSRTISARKVELTVVLINQRQIISQHSTRHPYQRDFGRLPRYSFEGGSETNANKSKTIISSSSTRLPLSSSSYVRRTHLVIPSQTAPLNRNAPIALDRLARSSRSTVVKVGVGEGGGGKGASGLAA